MNNAGIILLKSSKYMYVCMFAMLLCLDALHLGAKLSVVHL